MQQNVQRVVVAPHCDDETLGCGGLLAKYHDECGVIVLTKTNEVRSKEFLRAQEILDYPRAHFLELPDGNLGSDMHGLVGMLDEVLAEWQPQELYLPFPGIHQDHVAAYEAGMRAGRLSMTEGHWFTPSIFVYDVAVYDTPLYPTELRWNVFEALTEEHIDRKVEALEAYASQSVTGPHPANSVKQMAHAIGAIRQLDWAEQYAVVRRVRA